MGRIHLEVLFRVLAGLAVLVDWFHAKRQLCAVPEGGKRSSATPVPQTNRQESYEASSSSSLSTSTGPSTSISSSRENGTSRLELRSPTRLGTVYIGSGRVVIREPST